METENFVVEYKSILKVTKGDNGFSDLAKTCVCFANTHGGTIFIGVDDNSKFPPPDQIVTQELINKTVKRIRQLCFNTAIQESEILNHNNGGQYFTLTVLPSVRSIATTSDGKIFIRVGDECNPVRSEDISHLVADKESFQWELVTLKHTKYQDINSQEVRSFANKIRNSVKVSEYVKNKTDIEILEYYNLLDGDYLTNLGILWLGFPKQRARIAYPLTVQYIVYDKNDVKVRKEVWHDNTLNPMDLILVLKRRRSS